MKIAITMVTKHSPRSTKRMGAVVDGEPPYIPDYIYAVNILMQMIRYRADALSPVKQTDYRVHWPLGITVNS